MEGFTKTSRGVDRIYFSLGRDRDDDQHFIDALRAHRRIRGRTLQAWLPVLDADEIAAQLRHKKSSGELARMRKAASVTAGAFAAVYKTVRPGMNERDVHAMLVSEFMKGGAEMEAYGSIVAGGANACCLHYCENNAELKDGDLLLIDAGSQYDYYASDVTRTFPIGKSFSGEQKAIYEIVLDSQLKAIQEAKVGSTMLAIHEKALRVMIDGLIDLKLLSGGVDEILEKETYKRLCPHKTGHWLGMDVHDVGHYTDSSGKQLPLEAGMCFTIEPGIYIDPSDEQAPAGFKGIGVRIEDDILITDKEPEILTAEIAKSVAAMENRY